MLERERENKKAGRYFCPNTYYGLMLLNSGEKERGVELLSEAREGWAAIKHESGVQWIDELLAEDEEGEDAE